MSFTTPTAGNAGSASMVNEVEEAVNERNKVLYGVGKFPNPTPPPADAKVAAGDKIGRNDVGRLQQWVEVNLGSFMVSHADGAPLAAGCYDGDYPYTLPTYANLAAVFAAAGLAHSNWRRYVDAPPPGGTVQYGPCQGGDIIGHWVLEDLQAVLKVLVWTGAAPAWDANSESNSKWSYSSGSASWSAAQTAGEAAYAAVSPVYNWGGPFARSQGGYNPGSGLYDAELDRQYTHAKVTVYNHVKSVTDIYAVATILTDAGATFDGEGDFDGYEGVLKYCATANNADGDGSPATGDVLSGHVGQIANPPPHWCADPNDPPGTIKVVGYIADNVYGVTRWNVAGGFVYQQ